MATVKTFLKKTHQEVVVKVAGGGGTNVTISLAELISNGQELDPSAANQEVAILAAQWTGTVDGIATISRNATTIMTLQSTPAGIITLDDGTFVPDTVNATSDIVVTTAGVSVEVWLRLKKLSGYRTLIEPEQFGHYDNPLVAGE